MKQSFLDNLKGLGVSQAQKMIEEAGYKVFLVAENAQAINRIVRPKTVILWQEKGLVVLAKAGNRSELEKE